MVGHNDPYYKSFTIRDPHLAIQFAKYCHAVELSHASQSDRKARDAIAEKNQLESSVMTELRLLRLEKEKSDRENCESIERLERIGRESKEVRK